VDLDVVDSLGRRGCEPDTLCIVATTEADLVLELTWVVDPAWESPDGFHHVDLNLHLLHPDGWWRESPWDCTGGNRSPRWGLPGTHIGDPVLDPSDTDERPELLEMAVAEPLVYKMGVSPDRAYGADVAATVRVWIRGELVREVRREFATNMVFWEVGEVSMAEGVNVVDILHDGFP
jgi:hypothetical protein